MIIINEPYVKKKDKSICLCSNIEINGIKKELYYEIYGCKESDLCLENCDAFLVALIPLAMNKKYDIELKAKVSERLYFQLSEYYIPIIAKYQKNMHEINIKIIKDGTYVNRYSSSGVATGASGGVDSFYTICKYSKTNIWGHKLTHLLFANMCTLDNDDIRIRKWFYERKKIIEQIANDYSLNLLSIYSNLYEFYDYPYFAFSYFFAFTYASCVFAVQRLIGIYYQSSGVTLEEFNIKSSHDAAYFDLFNLKELSTENLLFYSAGIEKSRLEKIKYISDNEYVKKYLSVCAEEVSGTGKLREGKINCGKCSKCSRTIAELYTTNRLDEFDNIFDLSTFYKNKQRYLAKMTCLNTREFSKEIIDCLKEDEKITFSYYIWLIIFKPIWKLKNLLRNNNTIRKIYYKFKLDILLNGYRDEGLYNQFLNE